MPNPGRFILVCAASAACATAAAAGHPPGYAEQLSRVYEGWQFVQAVKEGCETASPRTRAPIETAFVSWRRRNQPLVDELDQRFMVLIRRASPDAKEYAVNVGRYAGAALRHVGELKTQFLAQPPQEISRQCEAFPAYLEGRESDLASRYATELRLIQASKP